MEGALGLHAAGLNVVYSPDLDAWRKRKVRVLNGAHHTIVFLGMRLGLGNVRECLEHSALGPFVRHVLSAEVLPTLAGDESELRSYSGAVLERLANPFLDHRLAAIGLNSAAKVRERLLPTIADYARLAQPGKGQRLPPGLTLALAAFLAHVEPRLAGCETTAVRQDADVMVPGLGAALDEAVASLRGQDAEATAAQLMAVVLPAAGAAAPPAVPRGDP